EAVSNWYADELDKLNRQELAAVRKLAGPPDTPPDALEQAIAGALPELPPWMANDFKIIQSQRKRAADLAQLAANALALLHPADGGFVTARNPQNGPLSGVSIFRPHNLNKLSKSNYLSLDFNRRAHWAAVLGATNLIACHARALWRLASSLLTTANATVRENLMRRLIGPDSVMVGYRQQFTALAAPPKLTLSLEPHAAGSGASTYRLRLESHETGATVIEQNSRVNAQTIDDALAGLEQLFKQPWVRPEALQYLTALGRTLGEDIIQNLAEYLAQEYRRLAWLGSGDVLPHLQLQLPRQLMRYPWELIHDGEGLLCERFALGRQVFMETGAVRQVTRRRSGVVRALIIGDPLLEAEFLGRAAERGHRWAQLPGAKEEAEQVALTFERLARTMGATLDFDRSRDVHIHQPFTKLQLRQKLRHGNYDIVHFAGHAIFNPQDPEQSAWLLSDGPLWAQEIRNTLAWVETPPWLVYANACEAGMDSGERANRYQGDVFGLATAFINQGVAAYIGPLWPIDDAVALQMAGDFYHTLLIEDRSLGEALHEARQQAKYLALGRDDDDAAAGAPPLPTRMGLSWAGLVLYGDPTGRLLESLWTPHHLAPTAATESPPAQAPPYRPRRMRRPLRPLQSPDAETCALVAGPGMESAPVTRGAADISPAKQVMELVETNGVRYWQTINLKTGARVSLPGSPVEQLARDETTRSALSLQRGAGDYVRLIGRWLIDRNEETLIEGLATRYDRDVVPVEQLLSIGADGSLAPLGPEPWWWLEGNPTARTDRALLIIHGTFSQTASPVAALKDNFLAWAAAHYRGVIGFDHWTLSKTPEENAAQLWQLLDSRLKEGENRLDIITHSRGGLVARALVELLKHHRPVNRVIFVCTPNSGTTAANPANWGRVADTLVNLLHHDSSALFGRLSGLLARLLALGGASLEQLSRDIVSQIPGLQAQNPAATGPRDFLGRLQRGDGPPKGVTYSAVAANYEPQRDEINIKTLAGRRRAKNTAAVDAAADVFFSDFNDLVVDTSHVWAIDPPPEISAAAPPAWLPGAGLLIFNPNRAMPTPPQATTVDKTGVHHTNVFYFKETQDFLRAKLSD
ncbi:MAG: CHAT domain-containing protein, partial [Anaerolineae bacterium]